MDAKKFKAIKRFMKSQPQILEDVICAAVGDYEKEFDGLDRFEKGYFGWSIEDQQAEANQKLNKNTEICFSIDEIFPIEDQTAEEETNK
jgi:hypothetical protein